MYREASSPCAALIDLAADETTLQNDFYPDEGWKLNIPWLYYQSTGNEVIYQSNRIQAKLSMEASNDDITRYSQIPFKLAKYAFDGTFLGWEDLTTQLFLCQMTEQESSRFRRVGLGLIRECQFDLEKLVDRTVELPNLNYFFELFLEDYNGDLIDIPVLIDNYLDSGDTFPNRGSDPEAWKFVRRFFLYENTSAIEGDGEFSNPTQPPTYVRFAQEMRFIYQLDDNHDETIYVPYLQIFYRSIESSDVTDSYPTNIMIVTKWFMGDSFINEVGWGFFIATHVILFLWVIWRLYKWVVLHPQNYESSAFMFYLFIQIVFEVIMNWSAFIFWFLFMVSFIWTAVFKFQSAFYVLLPDRYDWFNNFMEWEIIFGIMVGLKVFVIWFKIYYQCNVDVFFLDRERKKEEGSFTSPNAWRLIFVANEYNEMQMMQYVSMEFTLIWYVFFMEGVGWRYWSAHDPDFSDDITDSVLNKYTMFCISVLVLMIIGSIQYIIKRGFSFLFPMDMHNFVDLCSVTNISVFLFDQRIHGYYIHGESTGGQADVSFNDLKDYIDREENGEARHRGLLSESPTLQTFEIFLPVKIRQLYEVVYKQAVLQEINSFKQHMSALQNSSRLFNISPLPKGLNIQALVNQRDEMSQYFVNYISQVKNYPHIAVKDRGICQMLTNLPPENTNKLDTPVFLKDPWYSFSNVMF